MNRVRLPNRRKHFRGGGPLVTYATWNPLDKNAAIALSGGDLIATRDFPTAEWASTRATIGVSSGKWYFEVKLTTSGTLDSLVVGVCNSSASLSNFIGSDTNGWAYFWTGDKYYNGTPTAAGPTFAVNDVIGVAIDMDTGGIWFSKNGVWIEGDPAAGTGASFTGITGTVYPGISGFYVLEASTANFGASAFDYTVPSGFNSGVYT